MHVPIVVYSVDTVALGLLETWKQLAVLLSQHASQVSKRFDLLSTLPMPTRVLSSLYLQDREGM